MDLIYKNTNPKNILGLLIALVMVAFFNTSAIAQCTNLSSYGSVYPSTLNPYGTVTISTANYLSEYNTIYGIQMVYCTNISMPKQGLVHCCQQVANRMFQTLFERF